MKFWDGVERSRIEEREGGVLGCNSGGGGFQRRARRQTGFISRTRQLGRGHGKLVLAVEDKEEDEWPRPRGLSRRDGRRTREEPEASRSQPNPERMARGTMEARDESIGTGAAASFVGCARGEADYCRLNSCKSDAALW